jgi:F420-0:gamma-glutamyl ligase
LIPTAGIDESNAHDVYVLWPKDAQATANEIRAYLKARFGVTNAGVLITDSTCQPLRRGTTGIYLAHSGFRALHNYIGQPDLFGRPFAVSQASVAGGLAAAAVLAMGEGTEQTPLALLSDLPAVTFVDADPDEAELTELHIQLDEDLFAPFLTAVEWLPGQKKDTRS